MSEDFDFIAFMGGPSTGDKLADIIRRITPEDGAVHHPGRQRSDWDALCLKAAAHMREILPGIRERMERTKPYSPWIEESATEAALKEALVFRKQLLESIKEQNGDKNDG